MTNILARSPSTKLHINGGTINIFAALTGLAAVMFVFFGIYLSARDTRFQYPELMSSCIERYAGLAKINYSDYSNIIQLDDFCYNTSGFQLLVDEEIVRVDNFVFQRQENAILLIMVVVITLSGVVLAGLQLLASYRLAIIGKGELSNGGEISYSKDNVSFKSSVVGLVILAVSFGFFMVFVLYIYDLKDEGKGTQATGQSPQVQISGFVPNRAEGKPPANIQSAPPTSVQSTVGASAPSSEMKPKPDSK
jgi:hypothetical protein